MASSSIEIINIHINIKDSSRLVFWGKNASQGLPGFSAVIDQEEAKLELLQREDQIFSNLLSSSDEAIDIVGEISIPPRALQKKRFSVTLFADGQKVLSGRYDINRPTSGFVYNLEKCLYKDDGSVEIAGWAVEKKPVEVSFFTGDGTKIPVEYRYRRDLLVAWPELDDDDLEAGFFIRIPKERAGDYPWRLVFTYSHGQVERRFTRRTSVKEDWKAAGGIKRAVARSYEICREQGLRALASRVLFELKSGRAQTLSYQRWIERIEPGDQELAEHRRRYGELDERKIPLFSIVVPVYHPKEAYLGALIDSVRSQTYGKWELILADAGGDSFARLASGDERIKYIPLEKNGGISENTNRAIERASGEWIVFADHDDVIAKDALYQIYQKISEEPETGYIYTDEDKLSADGKKRFDPVFKTDFNPDLLRSENYISHLSAVSRGVLERIGPLDRAFDGSQDYDLTLRATELLNDSQIAHIPQVLYHWRTTEESAAADQENKLYAFEAGRRAVQAQVDRLGIPATVSELSRHGRYRLHYHWEKKPLVSIIIPNKDHIDDLSRCLTSIREKTAYDNYEIVIVENNSTQQETFAYYSQVEADAGIRVVKYEGGFNFSSINNYGASFAHGDYLLLLNNDTEVITPEWLGEMVGICMRDDVGIVGAKLYYPDGTIQHAGVILGIGKVAGHAFKYFPHAHPGTADRLLVCQDYSAVTGACMLIKRAVFDQVGGLSEELAVAFNDIDFCLKVREAGYRIVFTPFAQLTHYESKSRGAEDTAEKQERFRGEVGIFLDKWGAVVRKGDPYYNRHYSLKREDFSFNEDLGHE